MKLYRYMSLEEFSKLTSGCELVNNKTWSKECRSTSTGFCFLPESACTSWNDRHVGPAEAIKFLSGVVSTACINTFNTYYLLVEMECTTPQVLTEGTGVYAVPFTWGEVDYYDRMDVQEFSCTSYSRRTFVPTRYAIVIDEIVGHTATWYDTNVIPDFVIAHQEAMEMHEEYEDWWYREGDKVRIGQYHAVIRPRVHH